MRTRLAHLSALTVAAVLLGACGGSDSGGSIDQADSFPSAAVCNGEPNDKAPAAGSPDKGYVYVNDGSGWRASWFGAFGDNHALSADVEATVILCATITSSTEVERCDFEEDGDQFTLVLMEAEYDIEVRSASSAEVIATDTAVGSPDGCPFIGSWSQGEKERRSFPEPSADLARTIGALFG